jgi:hypothetical protein
LRGRSLGKIDVARLLEILEEEGLPEWKYERYVAALRHYKDLYQARQDTWGKAGRIPEGRMANRWPTPFAVDTVKRT